MVYNAEPDQGLQPRIFIGLATIDTLTLVPRLYDFGLGDSVLVSCNIPWGSPSTKALTTSRTKNIYASIFTMKQNTSVSVAIYSSHSS